MGTRLLIDLASFPGSVCKDQLFGIHVESFTFNIGQQRNDPEQEGKIHPKNPISNYRHNGWQISLRESIQCPNSLFLFSTMIRLKPSYSTSGSCVWHIFNIMDCMPGSLVWFNWWAQNKQTKLFFIQINFFHLLLMLKLILLWI